MTKKRNLQLQKQRKKSQNNIYDKKTELTTTKTTKKSQNNKDINDSNDNANCDVNLLTEKKTKCKDNRRMRRRQRHVMAVSVRASAADRLFLFDFLVYCVLWTYV